MELKNKDKLQTKSVIQLFIYVIASYVFFCVGGNDCAPVSGDETDPFGDCLKSPETVHIDCKVLNVKSGECLGNNVISVPSIPENDARGEINCTSRSPIDLTFGGFQLDDFTNASFVRNAENVFNEATYVFSVSFPLSRVKASREVVVNRHGSHDHKMSFFLFRPRTDIFSSNLKPDLGPLNQTSGIGLSFTEKKLVIPCVPNDPNSTVGLEVPATVKVQPSYDKTKGFIIQTEEQQMLIDPSGRYVCKAKRGGDAKEEIVEFEVQPKPDAIFEPSTEKVYLFHNSELRISCKYSEYVELEGDFKQKPITPKASASFTSVLQYEALYVEKLVRVGDSGTIRCQTKAATNFLKKWEIETLDIRNNQVLQLNKLSENTIVCKSSTFPTEQVKLQMVFCQGESECKLNEFCFDEKEVNRAKSNRSTCVNTLQATPCNSTSDSSSVCLTLPQTNSSTFHSQGMIRCSVGGHSYQSNYFVGFDKILYLDWNEAPISALIDIYTPNVTMYPHNSYPFGCKAAKFFSDGRLQWVIKGKDGSEILLHKNRLQELYGIYATEQDYQLYTVRESNIRLIYPNDYDVICMVPLWNATGWIRHEKRINVAAKQAPVTEIVVTSAVIITILLGIVMYVAWRLKMAKEAIRNLTEKEVQEFMEGNPEALKNAADKDAHEVVDSLPYDKKFEIPREKLLIDTENLLGKGAFGTVLKGRVEGISNVVAVKTVNSDCEVNQFKGFLSELKIMIYIGKHPNIVSLIGASTEKIKEKTLYIIVEFCANGSLESYLRKLKGSFVDQIVNNEIQPGVSSYENVPAPSTSTGSTSREGMMTTIDLLRWSYQTAHGMEYLAKKKVVHADLAARNVLIDSSGNAKITDFGLSRQLFDYTQYVKKQQQVLPWRSLAIESLQHLTFSTHSDVWAFGVLLWEIFSVGDMPYPGLAWDIHFVQQLINGLRLIKPPYCTDGIYNLMLDCWQEIPEKRPSFGFISQHFKNLLVTLDADYVLIAKESQDDNEQGNIYSNGNVGGLVPGYLMAVEFNEVDIGSNRKSTNIYINS